MTIHKSSDIGSSERCISFEQCPSRYPARIIVTDSKKTARHSEKMSKSNDRLCRSETCFLRVGFVDDNGIAKLREVVTDGSVESDFSLLD